MSISADKKFVGEVAAEQIVANVIEALNEKQPKGSYVSYVTQSLTESQKTQVRENIGVSKIISFESFPSEDIVNSMTNLTVFQTEGFYSANDGAGTRYQVCDTDDSLNIPYGNKFIRPVMTTGDTRDIYVDLYGVRRGSADYAERNSEIMNSLMSRMNHGFTMHFESGHYYFSDPIVSNNHIAFKGACSNAEIHVSDVNYGSYLHFQDLADGESAISLPGGVIQDLGIVGNPSVCSVTLDRTHTTTDPSYVVTIVDTGTTYGIQFTSAWTLLVQNVRVRNFTYGVYTPTASGLISGFNARQCKIGISVGNDVKITNVQVWNVMVGIELRGQLASATNVRGDSIGKHLIECKKGKCLLANIDGDYCVGSLIHYGGGATYIHLGQATACMGRVATKNAYSRSGTFDLRTLSDDDYEYCSYISIAPDTQVFGGHLDIINVSANPMDTSSGYVHPNAAIGIGTGSTVKGVTIKCNIPYDADTEYFNKYVIKNLSTHAQAANDGTAYLTDFDGQTVEDINFITPIGFVRSKRTSTALDRVLEFDSEVKYKISEIITSSQILTPGINLNDGVYEVGYFNSSGAEYVGEYSAQSFRNANYLPVEGGRTLTIYYDPDTWNKNDKGKALYIIQYDESKNVLVGRTEFYPYVYDHSSFTLNSDTAYVRLAFNKWSTLGQDLTDIKIALYYIEDLVTEFVEYGYVTEETYNVIGEKVYLTSPNGDEYGLGVTDSGELTVGGTPIGATGIGIINVTITEV